MSPKNSTYTIFAQENNITQYMQVGYFLIHVHTAICLVYIYMPNPSARQYFNTLSVVITIK